uniref:Rhomboid domain containing 3 n=1 Tax=Mustela putorius furo TaxID=9669 RepID=M3YSH5_MUSPF
MILGKSTHILLSPAWPLVSSFMLLLLSNMRLVGSGSSLTLAPELLLGPWQAPWLLTHTRGYMAHPGLLPSPLLLPTPCQCQEGNLGTWQLLHASALLPLAAGLIGVLLTGLGVFSAAVGYTSMPVQLAMLAEQSYPPPQGFLSLWLLLWLLLALPLLSSEPPFLAVLQPMWGLAYAAGTLQCLELSQALQEGLLCRALAGHRPLAFPPHMAWLSCPPGPHPIGVRSLAPGLPYMASRPKVKAQPSSCQAWGLGSRSGRATERGAHFSSGTPLWAAREEEMLQEGIQASLVRGPHSVLRAHDGCLSPVSVAAAAGAHGFPTELAVVASTATGRMEGALAGGVGSEVGTEVLVTQGRGCLPTPKGPGPL